MSRSGAYGKYNKRIDKNKKEKIEKLAKEYREYLKNNPIKYEFMDEFYIDVEICSVEDRVKEIKINNPQVILKNIIPEGYILKPSKKGLLRNMDGWHRAFYNGEDIGDIIEIHDDGRIRSVYDGNKRYIENKKGYENIRICINGKDFQLAVHRLMASTFIPNPENKKQVNHIDGDKLNNRLDNLEWCTDKENVDHIYKNGLRKLRFTEDNIRDIKRKYKNGDTMDVLSKEYGCSLSMIGKIIRGELYSRVLGD